MAQTAEDPRSDLISLLRKWGFWAVLTGAAALLLVFYSMIAPTMEPHPSAATQVGEMAGEMRRAAWRTFLGLKPPQPVVTEPTMWPYLAFAAPVLGVVGIILSLVSLLRRENWRLAAYGTGLGAASIVIFVAWWMILVIACALILVAVIENIGDIFGA